MHDGVTSGMNASSACLKCNERLEYTCLKGSMLEMANFRFTNGIEIMHSVQLDTSRPRKNEIVAESRLYLFVRMRVAATSASLENNRV